MIVIEIIFPAHRYHATPWDAHVNEGRVEWPPSPWRLLRGMMAVGYGKLGWLETPPPDARALIEKLTNCDPFFRLPRATQSHTRHYMPSREGKNERRVKVFDTFLRFADDDQALLIRYDLNLDDEERRLLKNVVEGMAYLGRAESWIEARLIDVTDANQLAAELDWIAPTADGGINRIRLLSPIVPESFQQWRCESMKTAADDAQTAAQAKSQLASKELKPAAIKKARTAAEKQYPESIIEALGQDNSVWQKQGWPRPPGSRWIDYDLPTGAIKSEPLMPTSVSPSFDRPTSILLAIDGEGKRGQLRPRMRRALPLMELLHSEAVRHADQLGFGQLPELTGTDQAGAPLKGAHLHAHWLPLSFGGNQSIDHVLVYAPGGFARDAVAAVSAIRWAYAKHIRSLSIHMVGMGSIDDVKSHLTRDPNVANASLGLLGPSSSWESTTPLVLRKYLSRRGKKTIEGQIREELIERGFPEPASIEVWPHHQTAQRKLKGFVLRRRPGKPQPPKEASWGLRLNFTEPIHRPLSLGYASHFGLGMFSAAESI